jgi:hypothetical protein
VSYVACAIDTHRNRRRACQTGFALGESLFVKSEREKTDAEAVQDWESEGGAPIHLHEEAFAEAVTRLTSNRKSQ